MTLATFRYIGSTNINGIIDLTDKGIGVRQSFIKWAILRCCFVELQFVYEQKTIEIMPPFFFQVQNNFLFVNQTKKFPKYDSQSTILE